MHRTAFCSLFIAVIACCTVPLASTVSAAKFDSNSAESSSPMIKAYKRDPLPIYDDQGDKVRALAIKELPAIGSAGARVVGAKTGFVGIMLDGEIAWLRLSTVDYVGDVKTIKCDAMALKFAKMEEDGLDQSLGLGCAR